VATSGTLVTTASQSLLWAFCDEANCGEAAPPDFTQHEPTDGTGCNVASDRIVSAAGTYAATCILGNPNEGWVTLLAAFK
jgi:hypothetical protein